MILALPLPRHYNKNIKQKYPLYAVLWDLI